jgi:hypothetical protein
LARFARPRDVGAETLELLEGALLVEGLVLHEPS